MLIIIKLFLAHLLGDFVLQSNTWVAHQEEKKTKSIYLYLHALIHGGLAILLIGKNYWLLALLISLTHLIIDWAKVQFQKDNNRTIWFIIDQLLHVFTILFLYYFLVGDVNFKDLSPYQETIWLFVTAALFVTVAASYIIRILLNYWTNQIELDENNSLKKAGSWIGILERLFILVFVISQNWIAIGFLITAKSVFRFGDLQNSQNRKLTEYILIGTLLSFGIAIFTGLLVQGVLKLM